jgi:hypothetical protein
MSKFNQFISWFKLIIKFADLSKAFWTSSKYQINAFCLFQATSKIAIKSVLPNCWSLFIIHKSDESESVSF